MSTFPAISQKPNTDSPNATGIPFFVIAAALISVFAATVSVRDSLSYWAAGKNWFIVQTRTISPQLRSSKTRPVSRVSRDSPSSCAIPRIRSLWFSLSASSGRNWPALSGRCCYFVRSSIPSVRYGLSFILIRTTSAIFGPALGCCLLAGCYLCASRPCLILCGSTGQTPSWRASRCGYAH